MEAMIKRGDMAAQSRLESGDGLLDSWKEIARYLNRDVRTVQRWEKSEALPVHRHFHKQMSSVYALKREIEEWRRSRSGAQSKSIENNRLTGRSKAKLGTAGRVWMSLGSRLTTLLHSPVGSTATSVSRRLMGW